jgi:adenine-specific DNA-methyltransferase
MKYLGNKTRLEEFLVGVLTLPQRRNQHALDLFAGTGSVSLLFKKYGLNTTSNDFLRFAATRVNAILRDTPPPPNLDLESATWDGFITNNYSELAGVNIFRTAVANHIDGARSLLPPRPTTADEIYYLAQVIEAADFRSNIMGSYESFYKQGWRKQCDKVWELPSFDLINNYRQTSHQVHDTDARVFLEESDEYYDFIYLDPPYNNRQYSSVFHVLETIALGDNPTTAGRVNKRDITDEMKSKFSMKRNCVEEMDSLLSLCAKRTGEVFMSYSSEGIVSIEKLHKLFTKYFATVIIHQVDYRRFKTNSHKPTPATVKEVLIHGIK